MMKTEFEENYAYGREDDKWIVIIKRNDKAWQEMVGSDSNFLLLYSFEINM